MNSRFLLPVLLAGRVWAHDPVTTKLTWTQEISRIVTRRCVSCHAEFKSYETARPWAKAIRDQVTSRRMPPWGAVQGVGQFAGDPSLSAPEIEMLVAWVEGGAPEGNKAYLESRVPAPATAPVLPRYSRAVAVRHELKLGAAARVVALRASVGGVQGSVEAWAVLPDGTIDRLIWLSDRGRNSARNYVLREPSLLPAGTRLRVAASPSSALTFYLR